MKFVQIKNVHSVSLKEGVMLHPFLPIHNRYLATTTT